MPNWTDRIVGARMAVDREFNDHLRGADLSRQEWGLVMTAVEFQIENPENPDDARLFGDTSQLPAILPEMERVANMNAMSGAPQQDDSGGVLGSIKDRLGFGGSSGVSDETVDEAERLVGVYTEELQTYLVEHGRWHEVCEIAAGSDAAVRPGDAGDTPGDPSPTDGGGATENGTRE